MTSLPHPQHGRHLPSDPTPPGPQAPVTFPKHIQEAIRHLMEQASQELEYRFVLRTSPILKELAMTVVGKVLQAAGAEIASLQSEIDALKGEIGTATPPPATPPLVGDADDVTQLTELEATLGLDANGDPLPAAAKS